MFRHIIWDFDGTLFDTYPCTTMALSAALKKRGISVPDNELYSLLKQTVGTALSYCQEKFGLDETLASDFRRIRESMEVDVCQPYPGVRELLSDVVAAGGYNYICTNRGASLFPMLERHGLLALFRGFATADDGVALKPDPALNLLLIEKYSMDKSEAVIVGDRELDVVSGQRAGIAALAYMDGSGANIDCADLKATSISDIRKILLGEGPAN